MAAGLPTIVTDCGGSSELVDDGRTGTLVPIGAPEQLAEAITRLAGDETLRRQMGERGRQRVLMDFSVEAMARSFQSLYQEVARDAAEAPPRETNPAITRLIRSYERTYLRRRAVARLGQIAARPFGRAGSS